MGVGRGGAGEAGSSCLGASWAKPYTISTQTCFGRVSSTAWQAGAARAVTQFSKVSETTSTSGTVMHFSSERSSQLILGREIGLLTQVLMGSGEATSTAGSTGVTTGTL